MINVAKICGHKTVDTKSKVKNQKSSGNTSVTIFLPIEKAIEIQEKYPNMSLAKAVRFHILITK